MTDRALAGEAAARRTDIVPGVMHCAKCNFELTRVTLAVNLGKAVAGDNETEPCPNGCGPLWPVTWEQAARKSWEVSESLLDRAVAAEKALADLRSRLGPRAAASPPSSLLQQAVEALEMAQTGLKWYRDMHPEDTDGSDDEADAEIDATLTALREHMKGQP